MLSYRHGFHAGNQADVFKHAALFSFLKLYTQKQKPFTAFDLNAGGASYNLLSEWSLKTGEAEEGIVRLLNLYKKEKLPIPIPEDFKSYLDFCLKNYDENSSYAGSPEIIRSFLQKDSNLILCDLHSAEAEKLKELYRSAENVHVHKRDCYETIRALTPPLPIRGFALFDPSYEVDSDYTAIAEAVEKVCKKWSVGIFIIWYPILNHKTEECANLKSRISRTANGKILNFEVKHFSSKIDTESEYGLQGSGLLITNPPWGMEDRVKGICEYVERVWGSLG
ncbi:MULTISPECIES: 23S rRNA (adenine(2030)-N(6))-methyltransferase RlmJ [unclassified Treponema]|uniref:23S rRNA (adenine(2030)-N(6))-methyltransferase RlmJ n=1 Tax=unclassified Treponema TaxID=2638727 RepID=UPI0020A568DC|nr:MULTISPECIES: 23S rRNA (adenine(2030)-N(6))-methyltransferase RlmJ [unclassified Treponema]UTC66676.1 23S rRNA (adenine(2030)-N(6))-methyltransferase RlmJ [Treponema sp. OMZ 789]UTC69408.1 23S rRNA (adenine(2030)-N(6))-methyltransferase RlmJ [Treponema sp. OMZ 790]UTC72122.1 23S rRNA (adenine(2030)-N(6))-methyltransferase RlmJ [Treponema sp. OMZ 791]